MMKRLLLLLVAIPSISLAYTGQNLNVDPRLELVGDKITVRENWDFGVVVSTFQVSSNTIVGPTTFYANGIIKGSPNIPEFYRLETDSTTISNTLASSPITFPVLAGSTYYFDCYLLYQTTAVTTGLAIAVQTPATPATISYVGQIPLTAADSAASEFQGYGTSSNDIIVATGVQVKDRTYVARLFGSLQNGANAGNLTVMFRSEVVAPGQVTLKAGSLCQLLTNSR